MIVGGGMSGTAANDSAGARTQLSTLTASLSVGLTLAILLPLFRNLPEAVLGAIVVHAVALLAATHAEPATSDLQLAVKHV
jgi:sulfate permease, SulP family